MTRFNHFNHTNHYDRITTYTGECLLKLSSKEKLSIMAKNKSAKKVQENLTNDEIVKMVKEAMSVNCVTPSNAAAISISSIYSHLVVTDGRASVEGLDQDALRKELDRQNEELLSGDTQRIETMLLDQSHTLQSMFTFFLQKMSGSKRMDQMEMFTRLALKSQNQCRQSLATLGELKNPRRATFIKQQNNAVNQQVNNENSKKSEKVTNELLEVIPNERLDTRTEKEAVRVNKEVEAVGKVNGRKNRKG